MDPLTIISPSESPYIYTHLNPIRYIDPDGNTSEDPPYTISNGVIKGGNVVNDITNKTHRPKMKNIKGVVLHRTAGSTASGAINHSKNQKGKVGFHVIIDKDGTLTQINNLNNIANHVGKAKGDINNYNSIGIEVVGLHTGKPGENKWEALTDEQIENTAQVLVAILKEYDLTFEDAFPHEDVSWKTPGEGQTVYNAIKTRVEELFAPEPEESDQKGSTTLITVQPTYPEMDPTGAGGTGVNAGRQMRVQSQGAANSNSTNSTKNNTQ